MAISQCRRRRSLEAKGVRNSLIAAGSDIHTAIMYHEPGRRPLTSASWVRKAVLGGRFDFIVSMLYGWVRGEWGECHPHIRHHVFITVRFSLFWGAT